VTLTGVISAPTLSRGASWWCSQATHGRCSFDLCQTKSTTQIQLLFQQQKHTIRHMQWTSLFMCIPFIHTIVMYLLLSILHSADLKLLPVEYIDYDW